MSSAKRIKRPAPERTQPIRNWSAIFDVGSNGADGPREQSGAGMVTDLVSRSVQLGYRVIDEYIRQGQRAAQQVGGQPYDPRTMASDLQQLPAQMGRFASDFAALWFEFARLAPAPAATRSSRAATTPQSIAPAVGETGVDGPAEKRGARARMKVEVTSVRPTEVSLDLPPEAARRKLVVEVLRAVDARLPLLKGVTFVSGSDGEAALRIRVPKQQPAGIYNGLILDADSGTPVGTVSVRIAVR